MEINAYEGKVTLKEAQDNKAKVVHKHKLEDSSPPLKSAVAENTDEDSAGSEASSWTMIGLSRTRPVITVHRQYCSLQDHKTIRDEEAEAGWHTVHGTWSWNQGTS